MIWADPTLYWPAENLHPFIEQFGGGGFRVFLGVIWAEPTLYRPPENLWPPIGRVWGDDQA